MGLSEVGIYGAVEGDGRMKAIDQFQPQSSLEQSHDRI
jgi:hypothetical protein